MKSKAFNEALKAVRTVPPQDNEPQKKMSSTGKFLFDMLVDMNRAQAKVYQECGLPAHILADESNQLSINAQGKAFDACMDVFEEHIGKGIR